MIRFPARSLDSRLDIAVIPRYKQSKCTCQGELETKSKQEIEKAKRDVGLGHAKAHKVYLNGCSLFSYWTFALNQIIVFQSIG